MLQLFALLVVSLIGFARSERCAIVADESVLGSSAQFAIWVQCFKASTIKLRRLQMMEAVHALFLMLLFVPFCAACDSCVIGLERDEYSVVEGETFEVCVEHISGDFDTSVNVTIEISMDDCKPLAGRKLPH